MLLLQSTSTSSNAKTPAGAGAATATPASTIGHHYTSTKYRKERQPSTAPPALAPSATRPTRPAKQQTNAFTKADQQPQSAPILRATYELESSQALEELLKKREEDLRKRRQHVEHLMKWHQRLDVEEAEVLQLERQLLNYNNVPQHLLVEQQQQPQSQQQQPQMPQLHSVIADEEELTTPGADINDDDTTNQSTATKTPEKKRASRARKMEKRLKDIDKSLKELSHISASSAANSAIVMGQNSDDIDVSSASTQGVDFVRTTGSKLNKLWRRLTSQTVEKYEPNRRYKLCKADLERLYEEAKMAVLRDFTQDEERTAQELLEKSATTNLSSTASPVPQPPPFINAVHLPEGGGTATEAEANGGNVNMVDIPVLNLNFSSGPSEPEEESANNSKMVAAPQGNYSPSVAEENFKAHLLNSSASSSSDSSEQQHDHVSDWELQQQQQQQQQRIENNVQMFIALTQRLKLGSALTLPNNKQPNQGLQRSLSDTQIAEMPKFSAATSHRNISANASQYTNTCITSNGSPSAPQQTTLPIHHRSKSSIAEISNIPNEKETEKPSPPPPTKHISQKSREELAADCSAVASTKPLTGTRASVITAVGRVSPIAYTTPSTTRDEEAASSTTQMFPDTAKDSAAASQPKLSYSGQVGGDSELKAREISSKLDEISAAVIQLSQANALPSYPAATATATISKPASTDSAAEEQPSLNEESNLSTDASSYSLHFANISIDRHSSPGSQHANTTKAATTTFTKAEHNASESLENSQIATFLVSPHNATTSKTFVKDSTATSQTFVKECAESELSNIAVSLSTADKPSSSEEYEPDFEPDSNDETHIEDISLPLYETTTDTTNEGEVDLNETAKGADEPLSDKTFCAEPMQMKDPGCQEQQQLVTARPTITTNTSPEKELLPPPPLPPPPPPPPANATTSTSTSSNGSNNNQLMPDILNELELRRHQLVLDNEHLKQYEHVTAVPYMYVREIPNKPPPPYVPPAHGSPMTTIFPSEERIKDITFRRTHELYCELLKTEYCNEKGEKLPSVTEEQITNIYERIILDICREYLEEHNEIVRDGDPTNFHSQLAFFNPPDRLRCIQKAIYKEVRLCLAMDKTQPKRTQVYSVYGQRAKQDHIGKIIIQEMYDEDDRWCNFHREESEVLHLIVEEMIGKNIRDMAKEVLVEEGGSLEEDEEDDGIEIEEIEDTEIQENLENTREEEGCLTTQTLKTSVLTEHTNKKDQTQYINNSLDDSSLSDRSPQEEFAKIKGSIIMTSST